MKLLDYILVVLLIVFSIISSRYFFESNSDGTFYYVEEKIIESAFNELTVSLIAKGGNLDLSSAVDYKKALDSDISKIANEITNGKPVILSGALLNKGDAVDITPYVVQYLGVDYHSIKNASSDGLQQDIKAESTNNKDGFKKSLIQLPPSLQRFENQDNEATNTNVPDDRGVLIP